MEREIWVCTADDRCRSICKAVFEYEYSLRFLRNSDELKGLACQSPPDLVLFHSHRADECIKAVKTMKRVANSPVFIISGSGERDFILSAWREGACGFLPYPPSTDELYWWVSKCLGSVKVEKSMLEKTREYMEINCDMPITLADCAAKAGFSAAHFCRLFRKRFGISPMSYLQKLRLDKACRLLEKTDMDLAGIVEKVGFSRTNYFCREFKKHIGISPMEYRMRNSRRTAGTDTRLFSVS